MDEILLRSLLPIDVIQTKCEDDPGPDLGAVFWPWCTSVLEVVARGVVFQVDIYHHAEHDATEDL